MPIYEYECSACGHTMEAIQKMTESVLTDCPSCHKHALQKLVSAAGFKLMGTGWYATDFRDKGKKDIKSEKKTEDTATSGEKDSKKTDSSSNSSSSSSTSSSSTTEAK